MTIEQKARAYDEALERANTAHKDDDRHLKATLERIFPELKESDDERIRKGIIRNLEYLMDKSQGFVKEELSERIAWLENQANQKSILNVPSREIILSIWDLGNEWKELTGGCISTEYGTQLDYIQKHWNESEYYLRETQGEHETDFKFELNFDFNVGQWIVACGKNVFLITKIDGFNITLVDINGDEYVFDVDSLKDAHLWSIEDAKDGDVLFQDLMEGMTFIYNRINPDMAILYSFIISNEGEDVLPYHIGKSNTGIGNIEEAKNIIHPATKEQRDTLFARMREAGYEWDAEKKELKKIKEITEE